MHLLSEPVHLPSGVDEDYRLGDCERFIQVAQCVQLPLLKTGNIDQGLYPTTHYQACLLHGPHLSFHVDVELADTLQGQLFLLDKNPNGVSHELLGHLKDIRRHCSRQQNYLVGKMIGHDEGGAHTTAIPRWRLCRLLLLTCVLLFSFWNIS